MESEPVISHEPIRWASRVEPDLIRRLYQAEAKGIHDDELIDEVGCALLARCESIRRVSERRCPFCGELLSGERTAESAVSCPACGWSARWQTYQNSYKKRRVNGPRAMPAFLRFVDRYPAAKTWSEKMLAIDAVIHAVHESLGATQNPMVVPAAENLIEGKAKDTFALLEALAGSTGGTTVTTKTSGTTSTSGLDKSRNEWLAKVADYRRRLTKQAKSRHRQAGRGGGGDGG